MNDPIRCKALFTSAFVMSIGSACESPSAAQLAAEGDSHQVSAAEVSALSSTCAITGWTATGDMATARAYHQATLLQSGSVLVTGGFRFSPLAFPTAAELYSPSANSWTPAGTMSQPRYRHRATRLPSGKVLITGGVNDDPSFPKYPATAELYDPATQTFALTGSMSANRAGHTATLLSSGKVLVAGGTRNGGLGVATAELYDPATGLFTPTGSMVSSRYLHTATLLQSGKVLVTGGSVVAGDVEQDVLRSAEIYDPIAGTWAPAADMALPRTLHAETLLPSGKVLISGGFTYFPSMTFHSAAELYDPATGAWSSAGSGCVARRGHGAVVLSSGKVLVAGGSPGNEIVEVYDPAGNAWSPVPTMSRTRDYSSVTALASGNVLVTGGRAYDPANSTWASAEVYRTP